jgi:hypothetical protein
MKKERAGESGGEGGKDAVPVQLFFEISFPVLFGLLVNHITYLGNSRILLSDSLRGVALSGQPCPAFQ